MVDFLDLIKQRSRDELTPRLNQLSRQETINQIRAIQAEIDDPDVPDVNELSVKDAEVTERTTGLIDEIIGGDSGLDFTIEFGQASSGDELAWYTVNLEKNFSSPPTVIGVVETRSEEPSVSANFKPPEANGPNSRDVRPDDFSFENRIEFEFKDQTREMGERMFNRAENQIRRGSSIPNFVENPLQNYLVDVMDDFFEITWGYGSSNYRGEGAVESVMGALGSFIGGAIDDGLNSRAREIEDVMSKANRLKDDNTDVQNWASEQVSDQAQQAYNETPRALYSALGFPLGVKIAPFHHRNVTRGGFQYLGYEGGMDIHYIAMG